MATAPDHDEALEERPGTTLDDKYKQVMILFDETVTPQIEQRALSLAARRFASIPGAQWEGDWGDQFENSIKPEINKVLRGVRKIETDYRQNRIVPDFRPAGGSSVQETADTLDGLHRADSYHFKAQQARDNAFSEAVKGGMGAYRLTNEWADPYDKESDEQRINPAMTIVDADQRVFFDGNSKLYDKSDAAFAFVLTAMTRTAFEKKWPDCATSWPDGIPKLHYDWYAPDIVLVAEFYEVEDRDEKLYILTQTLTGDEERHWSSEIDDEELAEYAAKGWLKRERRQKRRRVHKYTMSGEKVLKDQGFIAGDCIPIVPVYGNREFIDNQERFTGHVQVKMDSQRIYNAKVAKLSETDALAPREVPIFAADQMTPTLAAQWANQNIERHAYALVNPLINPVTGEVLAMGPIGKIEPPQVGQVTAALLQIANTDLTEDDQDGADEVVANTSAEAMDIAATRIDAKSDIYLDNMRQSVQREGEIYLSMAREVYYEPGRTVETMTEDGDDGEEVLQKPVTDEAGVHRLINDFTRGKYKVIADVTEATATRRDKTVKAMMNIASVCVEAQDQEGAQAAIITASMNLDGEGLEDFQKWNRKRALALGLVEPNDEEKKAMEEAQQEQGQQQDPAQILLAATAAEKVASAKLKEAQAKKTGADTLESMASAALKGAQAENLGGDDPNAPDGLEQFGKVVDIRHRLAETQHLEQQTALAPHEQAIEAHRAETQRIQARQKIKRGNEG